MRTGGGGLTGPTCALVAALLVTGCAGEPAIQTAALASGAGAPTGSITLAKATDCRPIRGDIDASVAKIVQLQKNQASELAAAPATVAQAFDRMFGSGQTTTSSSKIVEERTHIRNLNAQLAKAGCETVDVDAALNVAKGAK